MTKIPPEFYSKEKKEEVGGEFYKHHTLLPPIEITAENYESFKENIDYLEKFADSFGQQMLMLSSALNSLYNLESGVQRGELNKQQVLMLQELNAKMGAIAFAVYELRILKEKLLETNNFTIEGETYIFTAIMLLVILSMYSSTLAYIHIMLYFDEEFLNTIHQNFGIILSPKFEGIRSLFKVTEWQRKIVEEHNMISTTIH